MPHPREWDAATCHRAAYRVFIECVVLGAWMARLAGAPGEGEAFLDALCDAAAAETPAYSLDFVRLNLEAALPRHTAA